MAVTPKTFIELVNAAIEEAGAELEPLTSTNFNLPDRKLHKDFKRYVQRAWYTLQIMRPWDFMVDTTSTVGYPTIRVRQTAGNGLALLGTETIEGVASGASAPATAFVVRDGAFVTDDADFWITFSQTENIDPYFQLGEEVTFDSDPAYIALVTSLDAIDLSAAGTLIDNDSFLYQDAVSPPESNQRKLKYISYEAYKDYARAGNVGTPSYITKDDEGYYHLLPAPVENYLLTYTYVRSPQELLLYTDTLTGIPSEYQDAVMWLAIMDYADQDNKTRRYMTAKKKFGTIYNMLVSRHAPQVSFGRNLYGTR